MNVLICGHGGTLCRQTIQRLDKERHTVSLVTGVAAQEDLGKLGAFQVYSFSYANENLARIMRSADADVLLIQGVHDPLYDWRNAARQSVRFLSDLTNILAGAKAAEISRVIFLSALGAEAYRAENVSNFFDANEREMYRVIRCAEDLVHTYTDETTRATVLRLPAVFSGSDDAYDTGSICRRLAEQYLWEHELRYIPNAAHREMFYPDAAEAVYRVLEQQEAVPLVQAGGFAFTEKQLAEALKGCAVVNERILRVREEPDIPLTLREEECSNELEYRLKYPLEAAVRSLVDELQKKREREERSERHKDSFWREHLLPVLENVGLFCVILLITWLLRDTWVGENLNLFLIYVLLIGVTWGTAHALFASLLSGIAMFVMMQEPNAPLIVDYGYFVRFLELVAIGVTGGYMRDKYRRRNQNLTDENAFYSGEVRDLTRINDGNVYVRNLFEKRLTGYHNSLARIYEITSQLDFMEPRKVLFHAAQVLSQIMETPHAAVYVSGGSGSFFRLAAATSKRAREMGKSIRYDEDSFLFRDFSQKNIYQNRKMEEGKPTFAGAVYREDVPVVTVMVWMDEIERVNLYNSNLLAILCRLLESAVHRAYLYEESIYRDSYLPGTRIMNEPAFRQVLETFEEGRLQGLLEYRLFVVATDEASWNRVAGLVRDTDVLGEVKGKLYVLLSNSGREDAPFVAERFAANGMVLTEAEAL